MNSASFSQPVWAIQASEVLLCYLTGVKRWVGALEAVGPSTETKRIWKDAEFPARLAVKPLAEVCGFLSFERLTEKVEGIRRLGLASSLKPDFLQKTAEFFAAESDS